jgi:hypothetical protein
VSDRNERTIGGLAGRLVGKAREALSSATGNDEPSREDRLREAQPDSDHQQGLGNEVAAAQREPFTGAERSVRAAERVRLAATEEENRLEREAREAEQRAEHPDPKDGK